MFRNPSGGFIIFNPFRSALTATFLLLALAPVSAETVLRAKGKEIPDTNRKYSAQIGEILSESTENPAIYPFKGDELYVRARIVSTKQQENPFAEGDVETAWTQPVVPE